MLRLISIPFSHYNDKVRWALAHFGLTYREQAYLPGLHVLGVKWARRGAVDQACVRPGGSNTTPMLVTPDRRLIQDSGRILRWLDGRHGTPGTTLFPNPLSDELEREYGATLGPATRRLAYSWIIDRPDLVQRLAERNVGPLQAGFNRRAWPWIRERLRARFGLGCADTMARAETVVAETLASASERLAGSRHLAGDGFTAADLGFAAMLAPVLGVSRQDGYGAWLPGEEDWSLSARRLVAHVRRTPAGRHALSLFAARRAKGLEHSAHHRLQPASSC